MTERMYRAQILLDPYQRRRLEDLARREKRSISAVTRRVIDAGLEALESETELWKQRAQILAEFRILREEQPFVYSGDLINEARDEQDEDIERVWRSES